MLVRQIYSKFEIIGICIIKFYGVNFEALFFYFDRRWSYGYNLKKGVLNLILNELRKNNYMSK